MTDPNSQHLPEGTPPQTPSVFEPAPAPPTPQNGPVPGVPGIPMYPQGANGAPMGAQYWGPPVAPVQPPLDTTGDFSHRVPRWRWFMALLLIGLYPAMLSLLSGVRHPNRKKSNEAALPSTVQGLVYYLAIDLAIFGLLWGLAWAFSRADKDELLMRWRDGFKPVLLGLGYSVALRVVTMMMAFFALIMVVVVMMALGHDPKTLPDLLKNYMPKTDALFPKGALSNPLYLILTSTLLSFVAAGLREELWRTSCLAALRHLFPDSWSTNTRWITSIVLSSVIFALGHVYQGPIGVVMTGIIGAGLGVMTWRYRSIWPSVWAHGFFDATSFLLAAWVAAKKIPLTPPTWFGW